MNTAVSVDHLYVERGDKVAVNDISFSIDAGEVLCLLGPNGAGKSSTVESIEGYLTPKLGQIRVLGHDPHKEKGAVIADIGVMLQRGGIYPSLGPRQALRLFASYYPQPRSVDELLERLQLREVANTAWRRLSGGEQQRTSLALALIGQPRVLFLDEPTAGVDIHGRLAIREVIREQVAKGVAILLTTHELSEAEIVADRIAIMNGGVLAQIGATSELIAPGFRFTSRPGLRIDALALQLGVTVIEESAGRYRVDAESQPQLLGVLSSWLEQEEAPLGDLHARGSLEDLYLSIIGNAASSEPTEASRRRRRSR